MADLITFFNSFTLPGAIAFSAFVVAVAGLITSL